MAEDYNQGWGVDLPLYTFIQSNLTGVQVVSDDQVHSGFLFSSGVRRFDSVILGYEEYVTQEEYLQFKHFVASGGNPVVIIGNAFWGQVNFSTATRMESLVVGHGWRFDGKLA